MAYNPVEFENYIISMLGTGLTAYNVKVTGSYPSGNKSFPLITTNIMDDVISRDMSKYGVKSSISLELKIWCKDKVDIINIQTTIKTLLVDYGFKRMYPTRITMDNSNDKFYVTEQYFINYNSLTESFERSY